MNEAYDELNNSVNDLESVVANWESRPVIDIMRAASNASPECPSGFSVLSGLSWPGADSLGWYVLTLSLRRQWCPLRARAVACAHTRTHNSWMCMQCVPIGCKDAGQPGDPHEQQIPVQ